MSDIASEKSSNWMIKMLQSELFERLPATNIQKVFGRMERINVAADEVVVEQGGAARSVDEQVSDRRTRHLRAPGIAPNRAGSSGRGGRRRVG